MPIPLRPDRIREVAQSRWVRSEQFRSWLLRRRWFGFRSPEGLELDVEDSIPFAEEAGATQVAILLEASTGRRKEMYHIPLRLTDVEPRGTDRFLTNIANQRVYGSEAENSSSYPREVAKLATTKVRLRSHRGRAIEFTALAPLPLGGSSVVASEETTHILIRLEGPGGPVLMKSYKRVDGANREPRMLERLSQVGYAHAPRYLGGVAMRWEGQELPLTLFMEYLQGAENLFEGLVAHVGGALGGGRSPDGSSTGAQLGQDLAGLHMALVSNEDPLFRPEPVSDSYLNILAQQCDDHRREVRWLAGNLGATLEAQKIDPVLLAVLDEPGLATLLDPLEDLQGSPKIQTHQDLHLAQVLKRTSDEQIFFIDFEGEPLRSPQDKWRKDSPLRDLATLERSVGYVKHYVLRSQAEDRDAGWSMAFLREGSRAPMVEALDRWEDSVVRGLEEGYVRAIAAGNPRLLPSDATAVGPIVRALAVEKALYEVRYELAHRLGNVAIPLEGLHRLIRQGR